MKRRTVVLSAAMLLLSGPVVAAAAKVQVYKNAWCGCCGGWVAHLRQNGFAVTAIDVDEARMAAMKDAAGIVPDLQSCHTAFIEGYVVEGHVPAQDVARLLAERPAAVGLSVAGMPVGSPGMEGAVAESYEVLLILADGSTEVFARH